MDNLSNYGADLDNRQRTRQCNKCYVDIPEDVKICPECGKRSSFYSGKNAFKVLIILLFVVFVVIMAVDAIYKESDISGREPKQVISEWTGIDDFLEWSGIGGVLDYLGVTNKDAIESNNDTEVGVKEDNLEYGYSTSNEKDNVPDTDTTNGSQENVSWSINTNVTDKTPIGFTKLQENPYQYKGEYVKVGGEVSAVEVIDNKTHALVHVDNLDYTKTILVVCEVELDIKERSFILVEGTVGEEVTATITDEIEAIVINANNIKEVMYAQAFYPSLKEYNVDLREEQYGYEVVVEKIELADKETRIHIAINNNGENEINVYGESADLLQNNRIIDQQYNVYVPYPDLFSTVETGQSTYGVLVYPPINDNSNLTLYIKIYNSDFTENIDDYIFDIKLD